MDSEPTGRTVVLLAALAILVALAVTTTGPAAGTNATADRTELDGRLGIGSIDPGENVTVTGVHVGERGGNATVAVELDTDDGVDAANATVRVDVLGPDDQHTATLTRNVTGPTVVRHAVTPDGDPDTVNVEVSG